MMYSIACVDCHGPEGRGGRVAMMMWSFKTPDITWDNLTREEHHEEEPNEEEHEEHPPYTKETLKRAITKGLDPAGELLDELMPRWRMLEQDLDALVEFIETLK
jgi:mono/diheme cytochrome c family protein